MKRALILTGTSVLATGVLMALPAPADAHTFKRVSKPVVIHEDDPRFDCRTMGNRICGVNTNGVWYLVHHNPKGFPDGVTLRPLR